MDFFIIDLEGYQHKKFYIKELTVFNTQNHFFEHYFVCSPSTFNNTYHWLVKNHQLVTNSSCSVLLKEINLNIPGRIYLVNDNFKYDIVKKLTINEIRILNSPNYKALPSSECYCGYYKHRYSEYCSLKKCHKLAQWYGSNKKYISS